DNDLSKKILQPFDFHAALDALFDRFLPAALHLDHVPAFVAGLGSSIFRRMVARRRWFTRTVPARPTIRLLRFGSWQFISHEQILAGRPGPHTRLPGKLLGAVRLVY